MAVTHWFSTGWRALVLAFVLVAAPPLRAAVVHPMDPLEDFEIMAAADVLQGAGAALPTAIFQSIDLREPAKDVVLGFHAGDPLTRAATVYFRQNKKSYRSIVNLTAGTFTPPE